jgi:hypothetical protein
MSRRALVLVLLLSAAACSDGDDGRYSAETVQDVAKRFHEALVSGNAAAAAKLTRAPFRYKEPDRIWKDPETIEKNLAKEIPRFQHLLAGLDKIEAFSRADLLAGKWPRRRELPKDRAKAEVEAAGVAENGWLVRVCSDSKVGYLLVLNDDGAGRLAVQALEI